MHNKYLAGLFTLFISWHLQALETGWIELKKGSADETSGATIREVSKPEKAGDTIVTVAIPKSSVENPATEEVVVYGQKPKKSNDEQVIPMTYEWVSDYEHDYYGLVIKFGKRPVVPVRLYLKANERSKISP